MTSDLRRWGLNAAAVLVLLALAYVLWQAVVVLATVVIPVAVAVLLAALLSPAVAWLVGHRLPRWLVLTIFVLLFVLYDGKRIWRGLLRAVPESLRSRADADGREAFRSLGGYTRATVAVALVDAVAIGIGLALIGVPLVIPLASLVFLAAFVPYVGAFVAGFVAVLVALVTGGLVDALLVLGLTVAVQELEGEVLQPFLLGRAVRLHPLAVVLAVAVGIVLAGVAGALFAVPVVLVARAMLTARDDEGLAGA